TFLNAVIVRKEGVCEELLERDSTFVNCDKKGTYKRLLIKACGCSEHCQMGHQYRGMAGYKFEVSNEASLFMCEDLKDKQVLIVSGVRKTWAEFKNDHSDWDFDTTSLSENDLNRLRGKYAIIWQKIGGQLCQEYHMEYVMHNSNQTETIPCHYIMLLDASSSMKGQPWNDLIEVVTIFIRLRLAAAMGDRVTILVFNDSVAPVYVNEELQAINITRIQYKGHGTNFAAAFRYVPRVIDQLCHDRNFQHFQNVIIFMSDGEASYPAEELNIICNQFRSVITKFWTVALGTRQKNVLSLINSTMDGEYRNKKESCDLVQAYAEIAQNNLVRNDKQQ
ncbi:unnamed protein product, partial [Didymodactylos carnosus]